MIIDARSLPDGEAISGDICIIGGGAAGITLALELRGTGIDVVLLAGGDLHFDDVWQSTYTGPNLGLQGWENDASRLRMLGGATNHWAGNCMPLDPIDFEARPGIPYSGWPITRADLDPYYLRAQPYVETPGQDEYDTADRWARLNATPIDFDPSKLRSYLYAESAPTAFGYTYEEDLQAADNIRLFLNAAALEIGTNDTASDVELVQCANDKGQSFTVRAKQYVVAAGGIETPRLLLLSNKVQPAGLGNANDLVGRFFMDHLSIRPALTSMQKTKAADFGPYMASQEIDNGFFRAAIGASEEILRKEELPNFLFFVFEQTNNSPGRMSAQTIRRTIGSDSGVPDIMHHLENVLTDLDGVTNEVFRTIGNTRGDLIPRTWIDPWVVTESIPDPESRVQLVEARDPLFGQNQVSLDWRVTDDQLDAFVRATEILAEEMGRLGFGRIWSDLMREGYDWPRQPAHGKHHCGTTKMSADPKTGVVDADCRVHGISNLFVASSAVFPTHGAGTPTLTIVALAVRLADHLKARMEARDQ